MSVIVALVGAVYVTSVIMFGKALARRNESAAAAWAAHTAADADASLRIEALRRQFLAEIAQVERDFHASLIASAVDRGHAIDRR